MASLYYSSTAVATTLSSGVTNTAPTLTVGAVTGFPTSYPYKLILDRGTASEEAVKVTAASGTTLTVTRGIDGTSQVSHSAGATVEHGVTGQDFQDARNHLDASTGVHGITGSVVGTSDSQTLTNKILESPTINDGDLVTPIITDFTNAPHSHLNTVEGGQVSKDSLSDFPHDHLSGGDHGGQITKAALSDFAHTHHDTANGGLLDFAALSQAGTDFTPAWTAVTTNPVIGNGSVVGRYFQIGKLVFFWWQVTYGSTTTFGTGTYRISLPVTARSESFFEVGSARIGSSGNPNEISGHNLINGTTTLSAEFLNPSLTGDLNTWAPGAPPQTVGDQVSGFLVYEAA